jgi:hypothetical protein
MTGYDPQDDDRRDERREDEQPDVELPGADIDGNREFMDDASGASYDEQADRAQAVIDRAHAMDNPELQPDDASEAAIDDSALPGPDADERPA